MLVLDAALVSAEQPPLEKRRDSVNSRHDFVSWIGAATDHGDLMLISTRRQPGIAFPSIGMDYRPGRDRTLDEGKKAVRRDILDALKANATGTAAILFGCNSNDGFVLGFSTACALFGAAHIGFVNLDSPRQKVSSWPDHCPAQFVQPGPGRLVAAQPEFSLQAEGADAVLLTGDEPHRQKPHSQRLARILEHGTSRQGCPPMTTPTS